jgi:hypothetical protein
MATVMGTSEDPLSVAHEPRQLGVPRTPQHQLLLLGDTIGKCIHVSGIRAPTSIENFTTGAINLSLGTH